MSDFEGKSRFMRGRLAGFSPNGVFSLPEWVGDNLLFPLRIDSFFTR